jgi:hypothetical protein
MELRVAKHLEDSGFRVVAWRPLGAGRNEGECIVEGPWKQQVFVEVKSPGWEGEASEDERMAARLTLAKHVDLECRPVAPWLKIQYAVDKAYKKFRADVPNLLVIAADLFLSLEHGTDLHAGQALYSGSRTRPGYFADARYHRLGGVALFWVKFGRFWVSEHKQSLDYQMRLFLNPRALAATALPPDMQRAFPDEPIEAKGPLVGREPSPLEKYLADPSEWK